MGTVNVNIFTDAYYEKTTGLLLQDSVVVTENGTPDASLWQYHEYRRLLVEKDRSSVWADYESETGTDDEPETTDSKPFFSTPLGIGLIIGIIGVSIFVPFLLVYRTRKGKPSRNK